MLHDAALAPTLRANARAPSSFAARHGLTSCDLAVLGFAVLYVIAFGPFFYYDLWTPRVALMLAALPFGVQRLALLVRARDQVAIGGCLVVAWATVVGLLADAPVASIVSSNGRWDSVLWWSSALAMYALGRTLSPSGAQKLGYAFLLGCAASGFIAVLQTVVEIDYAYLADEAGRARGFGGNPVYFGATMAGAAAYCIRVYALGAPGHRRKALLGAFLATLCATLSGSRVALAACVLLVVVGIAVARSRHVLLLIPTVAGAAAVAALLQRIGGSANTSAVDRLGSGGLGPRAQMWSYGWKAFLDRPLLGYGLGRFRPATQRFFSPEFVYEQASDDVVQGWHDAHNFIVQVTVSLGVVGLALFAWFVVSAIRRSGGPMLWAAAGMSICWLLEPPSHVTFGLAALLLGSAQLRSTVDGLIEAPKLRLPTAVVACVTALLLSGWAVVSDLTVKAAEQSGGLEGARRAAAWNRFDGPVLSSISTAAFDPTSYSEETAEQVLEWSERAAEYEPGLPFMWVQLGIRQLLFDDVAGARESLTRAIELQPYHPLALAVLRTVADREGDAALAALVSSRLAEIDAAGREGGT